MKSRNAQLISKTVSSQEFREMFDELSASLIQDEQEFKNAIQTGLKWVRGCSFSTTLGLRRKNRFVVEMIADCFEAKKIDVGELSDMAFNVFADCAQALNGDDDLSFGDFKEAYSVALEMVIGSGFGYRSRCALFEFHGDAKELKSKYVNVLRGETLATSWNLMEKHENITPVVKPNADFEFKSQKGEGGVMLTFPEIYWEIDCNSVSKNARVEASWMAGVFVSFLRLALPRADYCHRPTLGRQEARFGEALFVNEGGVAYSDDGWGGFCSAIYGQYKVDDDFLARFDNDEIQGKLNSLFEAEKSSLAFRVANSLGWLARARQTKDFSERLLHNFTSLEALLSENSAAAPIVETISRSVSIILATTPDDREAIFKNVKRLYSLRSGLVHRGMRTANELDSNDVETITESCVATVLQICQLDQNYSDFLAGIKKATHGHPWSELD